MPIQNVNNTLRACLLTSVSIFNVLGIGVFEFTYNLASFYSLGFLKIPFPLWKYDFINEKYIRLNV